MNRSKDGFKPLGPHYKVAKAAELLGMSKQWVKQKVEEGKLDGYLLGNKVVISLESINAYLHTSCITGKALADVEEDEREDPIK